LLVSPQGEQEHSSAAAVASLGACQPYRRAANPGQHFHQSVAAPASLAGAHRPRKRRRLPHEKTRRSFAASSSQRDHMTLMFGAARFWRPGLSASRSFGFCISARGMRDAPRHLMRRKCFKQRWILERASPRAALLGSNS
jgi:hypothetical protein